jgi:CRP/FNR family cyclic AMP-dependent transcriptional regulator
MIKEIPLFACLDGDVLEKLQDTATVRNYPRGTVLFSKGDTSHSMYVIVRGKVKAVIRNDDGKEMLLALLGAGEYFGEMEILDGEPRSATMIAKTACQLQIIGKDAFNSALCGSNKMASCLLRRFLGKLRQSTAKIESLTFHNVYGRIVDLFLELARPQGRELVLDEKLTHKEIASMVGASREMVSRIMKELICAGLVTVDNKKIVIRKKLPPSF